MQTPDHNQNRQDEALEAPPRLVAALQRLPRALIFIPPTADEAVLRAARKQLSLNATGTECARPRAQQSPVRLERWEATWPFWLRVLLRPRTGALRWLPWLSAAAAAVVLLLAIPQYFKHQAPGAVGSSAFARWDLNQDGRVDILDAFALARQLKQGGASSLQLDVNGDGVVDDRDVTAIAARAVKLERGGHS